MTRLRRRLRVLGALAAALQSLLPARAEAFPSSRLSYTRAQGAEHCPDEMAVRMSVAARLGYDPFVPAADRTIVARIVRDSSTLRAVVQLVDQDGTSRGRRELSAPVDRCDELVFAMALSISLAIDPERAEASMAAADSSPPEAAFEERPDQHDAIRDTSRPEPVADWEVGAGDRLRLAAFSGAGGHATFGTAPAATGGVFVFVGLRVSRLSLALEGRLDAPAFVPAAASPDRGEEISASLFAVSLLPCVHGAALFACASATAGALRAAGHGVPAPERRDAFYAAAGGRAGAELPMSDELRLRLHLDLWVTLTRVEVGLRDEPTAWRAPAFAGALGAGLMARFP